jgi:CDP-glycerol glycerophosphotransferase (TagB/SpsB family)
VTDDYVKYLRNFQLRENQRVIQLWHACGAFKKFGQRGTNMSVFADNATHAQYNVMCVSSENIRSIYADAFNIDIHKVRSLGCPRTDYFFDKNWIDRIQKKVYEKYPDWKDKYVIIYAPTFRDINGERSEFHPELDFDRLSKELLPNQIFVVCPHPVMKNEIVEGNYDNIFVVRDFSTNDLMQVSDMLITDYSSVIFEYALLKKPIAFFCYDLANYNRGFYLNYPDDLPGDVYENQQELVTYLRSPEKHVTTEKYSKFVQRYMSACDGHSCERIARLINEYMEED